MKNLLLVFTIFSFISCSTIHFTNGDKTPGGGNSEWHHVGVFQLVEFSKPFSIKKQCGHSKKWNTVTTKVGFINGLLQGLTFGLYNPLTGTVNCK